MDTYEKNVLQEANILRVLRDGPGLRSSYNTWIDARDRSKKMVLIAGLGGMGVGKMWFSEEDRHKEYPGFDDAPEVAYEEIPLSF